jgi:hypothetical protein
MAEELWTKTPVLRVRVDESMVAEMYGGLWRQIHGGDGVWRTAVTNPWRRRHTENAHDGSMVAAVYGGLSRRIHGGHD